METGVLVLAQICDAGSLYWFSVASVSLAVGPTENPCF